jgi:PAS domain S-box-containing protein
MLDISARRAAAEALKASKEQLDFALEAGNMGVWDWDVASNRLDWSDRLQKLFGLVPGTFRGTYEHYQELLHPLDRDQVLRVVRNAIETKRPYTVEHRVQQADGSFRWLLGKGRGFYDAKGNLVRMSGVTTDVTERVIAEKSLEEAVRVRDEFISLASHELKTPLTSLQLQAQMAEREMTKGNIEFFTPERSRKFLGVLRLQVSRISRLVEDMLDVSRISLNSLRMERSRFDLIGLVREVIDKLQGQLQSHGCEISFTPGAAVEGNWDPFRIEQVLVNLLTNAAKYGAGRPILVEVGESGPYAVFSVTDQGCGIAPEDQARIFERFERVSSEAAVGGLGLGLYISRHIVQRHGGNIEVSSVPGRGSKFTVRLPKEISA